jgi:hypothetical protein
MPGGRCRRRTGDGRQGDQKSEIRGQRSEVSGQFFSARHLELRCLTEKRDEIIKAVPPGKINKGLVKDLPPQRIREAKDGKQRFSQ